MLYQQMLQNRLREQESLDIPEVEIELNSLDTYSESPSHIFTTR